MSILKRTSALASSLSLGLPPVTLGLPVAVEAWPVVEAATEGEVVEEEGGRTELEVDLARARALISLWSSSSIRLFTCSFILHTRGGVGGCGKGNGFRNSIISSKIGYV